MATPILMPKQGQSVETCLILEWKKQVGDAVAEGDVLCEVETDKATFEVEATAAGTLIATFYDEGDDVPVLVNLCVIGEEGESVDEFKSADANDAETTSTDLGEVVQESVKEEVVSAPASQAPTAIASPSSHNCGATGVASPRARKLAEEKGITPQGLPGSGPQGRIIERDVQAALVSGQPLTPAAQALISGGAAPGVGTGIGGRVTAADMAIASTPATPAVPVSANVEDEVIAVPVKGIRKLIADRMLQSLQTTAQLTMNSSADAAAILAYRGKLKKSAEELGLQKVTITDLILFAVARVLGGTPEMNAVFEGGVLYRHTRVHLGFAVDTPRGLMVPVIRNADLLSLKQISDEAKRLAVACLEGKISPDELSDGTFTITNLGAFGIESFTPVLNPPQVGILGVSNTQLKPVQKDGEVAFVPHLGLSLTIDHQVVDGAPAARFLKKVGDALAAIELQLALG